MTPLPCTFPACPIPLGVVSDDHRTLYLGAVSVKHQVTLRCHCGAVRTWYPPKVPKRPKSQGKLDSQRGRAEIKD